LIESATAPLIIDEASSRRIGGIEHATAGISTSWESSFGLAALRT
jgi:hypothetical protein